MASWGGILHDALRKEQRRLSDGPIHHSYALRHATTTHNELLRLLGYAKYMMWIALTCKIYIAWGMNSFIPTSSHYKFFYSTSGQRDIFSILLMLG